MARLRFSAPAAHVPAGHILACRPSGFIQRHARTKPRPRTRAERRADAVWLAMSRTALFSAPPATPRLVTGV